MRARFTGLLGGVAACLMACMAWAAPPTLAPDEGDVTVENFKFGSGETLSALKLHYLTLGKPVRDAAGRITNAVLLLHGTTGSARNFLQPGLAEGLFGAGQPIDLATTYAILPDGIGAGLSSKPSDGLHARFPHYGYRDQVLAQMAVLDRLGVGHLRLVLGTSMGGMQAWLWGETYPDAMDALVAIASTPAAITGRNMMWREMIREAIVDDPDWKGGDYDKAAPPKAWIRTAAPLFALMTGNAERLQTLGPTRQAMIDAVQALEKTAGTLDASDYLYTFESSFDYDPAAKLGTIAKPMLAINFEDDLLNPPALLGLPVRPGFEHVMLPGGAGSFGHQTLTHSAAWGPAVTAFLAHLPVSQ